MTGTWMTSMLTLESASDLSLAVKAIAVVALGLVAVRLMRRASAAVRHLMLATTFAGLLALPVVLAIAPAALAIDVPIAGLQASNASTVTTAGAEAGGQPLAAGDARESASREAAAATHTASTAATGSPIAVRTIVRGVWAAGALLIVAMLVNAFWQMARIRRAGVPWIEGAALARTLAVESGIRRHVDVIFHEAIAAPLTCGWLKPAIVLPADAPTWPDTDVRRALVHELEHVRRGDWIVQLGARLACALYWYNPLVWVGWRRLCLEAERACDDAVLVHAEGTEYAEQLVLLAQRLSNAVEQPALAMAKRCDLSTRVTAILDAAQRRGRAGMPAFVSALSAVGVLVLLIAPVRAVAASSSPSSTTARNADVPTKVSPDVSRDSSPAASSEQRERRRRPRGLDRALYEAAEAGDVEDVSGLISAGADVNAAIDGDGSPMIAAAREGRVAVVRLLLDRGADANLGVEGDGNPLIMAAREGQVEIVTLLLDRGARINEVVPGDENALIKASEAGQLAVVRLLIARGADVNARVWVDESSGTGRGEWRTPLSMARRGKHQNVVQALLAAGAQE